MMARVPATPGRGSGAKNFFSSSGSTLVVHPIITLLAVSRGLNYESVSGPLSTQPAECLPRPVVFTMDLHIRMSVFFYWPVGSSAGVVTQTNHGEDQRQDR